jgi:hypothetical protein
MHELYGFPYMKMIMKDSDQSHNSYKQSKIESWANILSRTLGPLLSRYRDQARDKSQPELLHRFLRLTLHRND